MILDDFSSFKMDIIYKVLFLHNIDGVFENIIIAQL